MSRRHRYSRSVVRCLIKPEWRGLVLSQLRQRFQAAMSGACKIVFISVLLSALSALVFAQDEVFIGKNFDLNGNESSGAWRAPLNTSAFCIQN